jgi:hypothetical protein
MTTMQSRRRCLARPATRQRPLAAWVAALCAATGAAHAAEIKVADPDWTVRWDTNVKYSTAVRMRDQNPQLINNPNDDGDRAVRKHNLISNRVDLYSEFDAQYKGWGIRASAAAWYDAAYNRGNQFDSPIPPNHASAAPNAYTDDVRKLHGNKAEMLDYFVFGKQDLGGGNAASFRLGSYTLMYGESLFFGANGIANAQVPIDVIKAMSVPNSQFKEIGMPVRQVSAQLQFGPNVSLGAYYHLEWKKYRLPGANTYFSQVDIVDAGAESAGPGGFAPRQADLTAPKHGEFGMQFKFKLPGSYNQYGLYAARYHDKVPVPMIGLDPTTFAAPGGPYPGMYRLVYPQGIRTYGASMSTVIEDANVSAEISYRDKTPISPQQGAAVTIAPLFNTYDGKGSPLYPTGKSFHAQVSAITLLPASFWYEGATFMGEIAFNRRLSYRLNDTGNPIPNGVESNATRDAMGTRFVFEPQYFQVLPSTDISVPMGLGYNPFGKSSVSSFGPQRGGDMSIGISFDYAKQVRGGLSYTHYYGGAGQFIENGSLSFKQSLADRDFVSLTLQTTF